MKKKRMKKSLIKKSSTKKSWIWIVGIALAVVIIIGFYVSNQNKEDIKIGIVLPLTGDAVDYGQAAKHGADLAVAKVLKDKNIKLEVIYEDSQMDPKKAVDSVTKLINVDGVKYVVGFSSGETLAMCPISEPNKVILMATGTSPEITTKCGDYTFRNMPSDIYQGKELADKIYNRGHKNIAVLYINNDYGVGLKEEFIKNFNGNVLLTETHQMGDSDFKTQLTKIKEANPEAILLISQLTEGSLILRQKAELGMNQPIFASETLKDPSLIQKLSKESLKDVYILFISQYDGKEFQEFRNNYKQEYHQEFGAFSDYVYDNVLTLANAIKLCNGANDVSCVKDNIYKINMAGATGSINFDNNGDRINKPYTLYKIENNDFVPAE